MIAQIAFHLLGGGVPALSVDRPMTHLDSELSLNIATVQWLIVESNCRTARLVTDGSSAKVAVEAISAFSLQ